MKNIENNNLELYQLIQLWTPLLLNLEEIVITKYRNSQKRNIKQIIGHMIDSASNNTHRIIHLQYQQSPVKFPNYATHGNNDRWIHTQNYEEEIWEDLVKLWKYIHLHLIHIVKNIDTTKLNNLWNSGDCETVSLNEMILDFLRHFKLHISEIEELRQQKIL